MKELLLVFGVAIFFSACQMPLSDSVTTAVGNGESRAAVTLARGIYDSRWDRTVNILTTIHWARINTGTAVEATVDPDEVVIGGGAAVGNYEGTAIHPFLTASYPVIGWNATLGKIVANSWRAEAKEMQGKPFLLYAYAVGMKLKDRTGYFRSATGFIPKTEVQRYIQITTAQSANVAHPSATAVTPAGYNIVSGGARVYNLLGDTDVILANYLTGSYYNRAGGWTGSSKDHLVSAPATMIAYAISLPKNNHTDQSFPHFGDIRVTYAYVTADRVGYWDNVVATQGGTAGKLKFTPADGDWCPTGVGALSEYNGSGRMLNAFYFVDNVNVFAGDRDYSVADSGFLHVQRLSIEVDDNEE